MGRSSSAARVGSDTVGTFLGSNQKTLPPGKGHDQVFICLIKILTIDPEIFYALSVKSLERNYGVELKGLEPLTPTMPL